MFGTETLSIRVPGTRPETRPRVARRAALAAAFAAAALLAGCGGTAEHPAEPPNRLAGATTPRLAGATTPRLAGATTPAPPSARATATVDAPRVGTTQRVDAGGAHLSVNVLRVIDLPADDDAPVLPGFRGVGVEVAISNTGPAVYNSLATSDLSVTATDPNVHLLYVPSGVCRTPARDFDSDIVAGEHRSGCLAFRIHVNARVTAVTFSPYGKAAGEISWGR